MLESIARTAIKVGSYKYFFASGVMISMGTNALFSALAAVPRPNNYIELLVSFALFGVCAYIIWSLGSLVDVLEKREDRLEPGALDRKTVESDIISDYATLIAIRFLIAIIAAILAFVVLALGQL